VGKTTVVQQLAEWLGPGSGAMPVRGFVTAEMRHGGARKGFRVQRFDGTEAVLAHVEIRSAQRVGKYGVDVDAFERVALPALDVGREPVLHLVDEIGKMECCSRRFVEAMRAVLDSGDSVVATVAAKGGGFVAEVKDRADVQVWEVTRDNRDALPRRIAEAVQGKHP
jgi:nucleoside-triphosphatase